MLYQTTLVLNPGVAGTSFFLKALFLEKNISIQRPLKKNVLHHICNPLPEVVTSGHCGHFFCSANSIISETLSTDRYLYLKCLHLTFSVTSGNFPINKQPI